MSDLVQPRAFILNDSYSEDRYHYIQLAKGTAKAYRMIRRILPPIVEDRETYVDIAKLVEILRNGELLTAVESSVGKLN